MKRFFSLVLVAILLISIFPQNCLAVEIKEPAVIYFEDGSYMTETIRQVYSRTSGAKTATKEKTYYDGNGNADWKVVLTGSYTYTGSSSTCTASSCSVTIYDSDWYTISKSASKSDNTATASVTMGYKLLGVTVNKVSADIALTCDKDGNLS